MFRDYVQGHLKESEKFLLLWEEKYQENTLSS